MPDLILAMFLLSRFAFVFCLLIFSYSAYSQQIIPAPQKTKFSKSNKSVRFDKQLIVVDVAGEFKSEVEALAPFFRAVKGVDLKYSNTQIKEPAIVLQHVKSGKNEGYKLKITQKGIELSGSSAGIFYGLTSLLQLAETKVNWLEFREQQITDYPQFAWRGLHLDVCRHFFSVAYVKRYIDLMALHKFNTFHWHLTEDQGWRIEIKKYPKLTSVGAFRNGTMVGQYRNEEIDTVRYGGFYTQEEIKEVVDYAAKRHVTIVPEIEMPGHALAAIAAYPELSCKQQPVEVAKIWGVFDDVYCAGNDSVFTFLENVLDEVCALFPGQYIHIGGDECPKERWKTCGKCQARIKTLGLKDEHELQSYFIQRMEKYLNKKGKKIIGWDEILEGGLAPNAAVMSWRGTEGAIAAVNQKHPAVLTPGSHCYFDHYQGNPLWEPVAIGGYTNVQKVYGFNPIPAGFGKSKQKLILGGQANLWSEYILSEKQMDYMVYPRAAAMAEALWLAPEKKNLDNFLKRLDNHYKFYKKLGVNVSQSHYQPEFVSSLADGKFGLAVKPATHNPFVLEYLPAKGSDAVAKKLTVQPDSLLQGCTALAATYRWQYMSLPASGKVVFHTGAGVGQKDTLNLNFSLASGRPVQLITPLNNQCAKSAQVMVDGMTDDKRFYSPKWAAFDTSAVSFVIDFEHEQQFKNISISSFDDRKNGIFRVEEIQLEISTDGMNFKPITAAALSFVAGNCKLSIIPQTAKLIKITARSKPASGTKSKMMIDEVWVE